MNNKDGTQKDLFFVDDLNLLRNNLVFIRNMANEGVKIIPLSDIAYEWLRQQQINCIDFHTYEYNDIYKGIVYHGEIFGRTWYLSSDRLKDFSLFNGISCGFLIERMMIYYFIDTLKVFCLVKHILTVEHPKKIFIFKEISPHIINKNIDVAMIRKIIEFLAKDVSIEIINPKFNKKKSPSLLVTSTKVIITTIFSYFNCSLNYINDKLTGQFRKKIVFFESFRHIKTLLKEFKYRSHNIEVIHLEKEFSLTIYLTMLHSKVKVHDLSRYYLNNMPNNKTTDVDSKEFEENIKTKFIFNKENIYGIIRERLMYILAEYIPKVVIKDVLSLNNYLISVNPYCIVTENDTVYFEKMLTMLAKSRGIKTIVVQHGITFDFPDSIANQDIPSFAFYPLVADKFLAYGQSTKDWFTRRGICEEKIILTGSPRYDIYYHSNFNINPGKMKNKITRGRAKLVLFVLSEFSQRHYIPAFHHNIFQAKCQVKEIVKIADDMEDVFFIIRPRAKDNFNISILTEQAKKNSKDNVCINAHIDLNILFRITDVCIGAFSSVLTEAIISGVPLITIDVYSNTKTAPCSYHNLSQHVNSYEELRNLLYTFFSKDSLVKNSMLQKIKNNASILNYGNDGRATDRVAEYILNL